VLKAVAERGKVLKPLDGAKRRVLDVLQTVKPKFRG
jgi:hypothetical protein